MKNRDFRSDVGKTWERIRDVVMWTPLERSPDLSERYGADVFVKWESEQLTGSFKIRGALSAIRNLPQDVRARGLVSASTGNHGLAVAKAAELEKTDLMLFVPESVSPAKLEKLRRLGIDVEIRGASCEQTERLARAFAGDSGKPYIPPYNDIDVILGQGTAAFEIHRDLPGVDAVLVPVGGGGLAAGLAAYLKSVRPEVQIFGVEPETSAFMNASIAAGRLVEVEEKPTTADAVAGGIEPGSITFDFCRKFLDGIITVTETAISDAVTVLSRDCGRVIEAAGALALAGLDSCPEPFHGLKVVLIASGGNAS
ncbi:MAG: pyridoxal-phosphate dependent enzyme [Acidobacteriota bacterium]|nr:pyridoxal-phosphate dependent enzyme [Acidobacteriota bacterium]